MSDVHEQRARSLGRRWRLDELRRVLRPLPAWSLRALDDGVRREAITRAERAAAEPFPALPATLFLDYFRRGRRAAFEKPRFDRRRILRDLVIGEALELEGRFLDRITDVVWATCEETWWGAPAHLTMQGGEPGLPDPDEPIVDLFAAETAGALAWTVHLIGTALREVAPLAVRRIGDEVQRRILDPCLRRDDFWWMGISDVSFGGRRGGPRIVNNWNPWITSNWIAAAVIVENDAERRARSISKAVVVLDQYLAAIPFDGSCDEGTAYWSRAGGTLFEALELLFDASGGAIDAFDDPVIANVARFVPRMQLAGAWYVDFGDGSPRPELPAGVVYRFGRRISDEAVITLGAELLDEWRRHGPSATESLGRVARSLEVLDEARTVPRLAVLPRFTWLPGDEVMVARDRSGSGEGFTVAARAGHNGASHGHNDIGSFIVVLDNEPLVIDAGVGSYTAATFGPQRYEIWTIRSAYHNVPAVGGLEQGVGTQHAAANVRCTDSDEAAVLTLDLAGAYPDRAGIERWMRTVRLRRGEAVVVDDAWTMRADSDVELNLLLRDRPDVDVEAGELRWATATIAFDPVPRGLAVERVALDDPTLQSNWERRELWRATATYHATTTGSARTTIVRARPIDASC